MRAHAPAADGNRSATDSIFDHVLVGLDETPESLVAAGQAGALRSPDGRLLLLAVAEKHLATHAGLAAAHAGDKVLAGAEVELAQARELVDADEAVLASGRLVELLCRECERRDASLIALGVRPHGRLAAFAFGGNEVWALHDAPCSVLIARPGWGPHKPERIVVGVDGSPASLAAESVARSLAARLGCELAPVVSVEHGVDAATLRAERDDAVLDPRNVLDAVVAASNVASLIVVGRGQVLGRRGDLAARIVHAARCSVLVVQPPSDDA